MTENKTEPEGSVCEPRELLPCPFCGGEAYTVRHMLEDLWGAHCTDCTAKLHYIGLTRAEAIAAWNTRTATEAALANK